MTRARALAAAVPQRVYTAVAGLVLLASLGVAVVLGAGLATWQGAVSHVPAQGQARPPAVVAPPRSAVVVVPTPRVQLPHVPANASSAGSATVARPVPAMPPPAAAAPSSGTPKPPAHAAPAPVTAPVTAVAAPRLAAASSPAPAHGKHHRSAARTDHGKHLGWTKGVRGAGHGRGHGLTRTHG